MRIASHTKRAVVIEGETVTERSEISITQTASSISSMNPDGDLH